MGVRGKELLEENQANSGPLLCPGPDAEDFCPIFSERSAMRLAFSGTSRLGCRVGSSVSAARVCNRAMQDRRDQAIVRFSASLLEPE